MKSILITSLLFFAYLIPIQGQVISNIGLNADVLRMPTLFTKYKRAQGYISLNILNRIDLIAEAGFSHNPGSNKNYDYTVQGSYFKYGIDLNIRNAKQKVFYTVGLRYAFSSFNEKQSFTIYTSQWPADETVVSHHYIRQWVEIPSSLNLRLYKNLYTQLGISFKFGLAGKEDNDTFYPDAIPGYGLSWVFMPGFTYGLRYFIPFSKDED